MRGPRVPSARGPRAPSGGCRGAQRPLAARGSAAAVTARPGTDWGHLQPFPPVFNSPSGRRRGAGGSTQSSPPRAPPRGLQLVRGRCGRRLLLPPSLPPVAPPRCPLRPFRFRAGPGPGPGWSGICCGRCSTTTAPGCWRCSGPSSTTTPTSEGCCRRRGQPPSRPAGERPARRLCGEGLGGPGGVLRGLQRVPRGSRGRPQRPQRLVVPRRGEVTGLEADIQRFIAQKADLLFAQSWQPNGPIAENIEEDDGEGRGLGVLWCAFWAKPELFLL